MKRVNYNVKICPSNSAAYAYSMLIFPYTVLFAAGVYESTEIFNPSNELAGKGVK